MGRQSCGCWGMQDDEAKAVEDLLPETERAASTETALSVSMNPARLFYTETRM